MNTQKKSTLIKKEEQKIQEPITITAGNFINKNWKMIKNFLLKIQDLDKKLHMNIGSRKKSR